MGIVSVQMGKMILQMGIVSAPMGIVSGTAVFHLLNSWKPQSPGQSPDDNEGMLSSRSYAGNLSQQICSGFIPVNNRLNAWISFFSPPKKKA
jgi:hypothetical protein